MLRAEAAVAVVETIAAIGDFAVRSEQARIAAADLAFLDDSFQTRAIFPTHQLVCAEKIVDALLAAPS